MNVEVVFACSVLFFHHQNSGVWADNCARKSFSGDCQHCKTGWFGDKCDKPCHGRCDVGGCDKHIGVCHQCGKGYHGLYCDKECPINCKRTNCDRDSGHCYLCKRGWWGNRCYRKCPQNCANGRCSCRLGTCASCKEGWWGDKCTEPCSDNSFCQDSKCRSTDGFCSKGCETGYTGPRCASKCSSRCVDHYCSQLEGACFAGCEDGWYGSHCDMDCPQKCIHCNQKTGLCTYCEDGWHGTSCDSRCPTKCAEGKCDMEGNCIITATGATNDDPNHDTNAVGMIAGAAAAGGGVLVVLVLVFVGLFIRERNKNGPVCRMSKRRKAPNSSELAYKLDKDIISSDKTNLSSPDVYENLDLLQERDSQPASIRENSSSDISSPGVETSRENIRNRSLTDIIPLQNADILSLAADTSRENHYTKLDGRKDTSSWKRTLHRPYRLPVGYTPLAAEERKPSTAVKKPKPQPRPRITGKKTVNGSQEDAESIFTGIAEDESVISTDTMEESEAAQSSSGDDLQSVGDACGDIDHSPEDDSTEADPAADGEEPADTNEECSK